MPEADRIPNERCAVLNDDFLQYWLGAYVHLDAATWGDQEENPVNALSLFNAGDPFGTTAFNLNGGDSADNQDHAYSMVTTSSVLHAGPLPAVQVTGRDGARPPAAVRPAHGHALHGRLVQRRGLAAADQADRHDRQDHGRSEVQDLLRHRSRLRLRRGRGPHGRAGRLDDPGRGQRRHAGTSPAPPATSTGTRSTTSSPTTRPTSARARSRATRTARPTAPPAPARPMERGDRQLRRLPGLGDRPERLRRQARSRSRSPTSRTSRSPGLGVFLDDAVITKDGATEETSFEGGNGGWTAGPAPEGTENDSRWANRTSVGYKDGPGVATDDTLYYGFGFEGIRTGASRNAFMARRDALPRRARARRRSGRRWRSRRRPGGGAGTPGTPATTGSASPRASSGSTKTGARRCGCPAARR